MVGVLSLRPRSNYWSKYLRKKIYKKTTLIFIHNIFHFFKKASSGEITIWSWQFEVPWEDQWNIGLVTAFSRQPGLMSLDKKGLGNSEIYNCFYIIITFIAPTPRGGVIYWSKYLIPFGRILNNIWPFLSFWSNFYSCYMASKSNNYSTLTHKWSKTRIVHTDLLPSTSIHHNCLKCRCLS